MTELPKALILYFLAVLDDGDWKNDWLTHLPTLLRTPVRLLGQFLAGADVTVYGRETAWFWLAQLLAWIQSLLP